MTEQHPPHPEGRRARPMLDRERVIALALGQVGYHEGRSNGHWDNREKYAAQVPGMAWVSKQGQPWCAVFACWCFQMAGLFKLLPKPSAACQVMREAWQRAGRYSEYPALGAQVFFGTPRHSNHTGLVIAYDANTITTVEGNTNTSGSREGDGVYRKVHRRRDAHVLGYGYPAYREGVVSADPAWKSGHRK